MNHSIDLKALMYLIGTDLKNRVAKLWKGGKEAVASQINAVNEMEPLGPESALMEDF